MVSKNLLKAILMASAFGLFVVATPHKSHAQEGIGERIGERIDQGIEKLGNEIRENWNSLRQFVDKLGVQGRVYARLRWDKNLENANLEIDVNESGIVELRGRVASELAKQKAVELARDTIGVTDVVDNLVAVTEASK